MDLVGPYFICIGAQKAGTHWLYDQLNAHPDIWMPPVKELHYFDRRFNIKKIRVKLGEFTTMQNEKTVNYSQQFDRFFSQSLAFLKRGINYDHVTADLNWYRELFRRQEPLITGEITPAYSTLDEETVKTICRGLTDTKFIFFVRDPVERIWSQLRMFWRRNRNSVDLAAWASIERTIKMRDSIRKRSYPSKTFNLWNRNLTEDRFKVFFFDDLLQKPEMFRSNVFAYLDVDQDPQKITLAAEFDRKTGQRKIQMSDEIRKHLVDLLEDELVRCAAVFGGPAQHWAEKYGLM